MRYNKKNVNICYYRSPEYTGHLHKRLRSMGKVQVELLETETVGAICKSAQDESDRGEFKRGKIVYV